MSCRPYFLLLFALLSACAVPQPSGLPDGVLPAQWQGLSADSAPEADTSQPWWHTLDDRVLNALVETALSQNQNLESARHRLNQARVLNQSASVAFMPTVSLGVQSAQDASARNTYLQAGLVGSWALAWPAEREGAARLAWGSAGSAIAQWQATRVGLVAEVARTYGLLRLQEQERVLLQRAYRLLADGGRQHAALMTLGVGTEETMAQLTIRALRAQASEAEANEAIRHTRQALAVLLGQTVPDFDTLASGAIPEVPAFRFDRLPATLLETRPQIALARAEVLAEAGKLGMSQAALYPRIALTGAWIYAHRVDGPSPGARFNALPSFGPMLDIPILDWGLRAAQRDAQQHALAAAVARYRQAIIEGYALTQTALDALNASNAQLALALAAQTEARQAEVRVAQWVTLGVRSAQDSREAALDAIEATRHVLHARSQRLNAFVALYEHAGGDAAHAVPGDEG